MYRGGDGVTKSVERATSLHRKACEGGFAPGCTAWGLAYAFTGVPEDQARAVRLLGKGCSDGDPQGCSNLAFMHRSGTGVPRSPQRARSLYQKACDGGYLPACQEMKTLAAEP